MNTQRPALDQSAALLAESLCARLCHDLSSPLGMLIGALELAAEDPASLPEALPLASEAAGALGRRLRLLRAAWAGDCGPLSTGQIAELAAGLPPRVAVELVQVDGGALAAPVARLLLNLLLLAAEALPQGGRIVVAGGPDGDLLLTLAGTKAAWPAGLPAVLMDGDQADWDNPRTIQAPLCAMLARAAGFRLSLLLSPGGVPAQAPPLLVAPR